MATLPFDSFSSGCLVHVAICCHGTVEQEIWLEEDVVRFSSLALHPSNEPHMRRNFVEGMCSALVSRSSSADSINTRMATPASFTDVGVTLETWVRHGSVKLCRCCKGLEFSSLNEKDLHVTPESTLPIYSACLAGKYRRPQPLHVPHVLRGLSDDVVVCLSSLRIHEGERVGQCAGYTKSTRCTRFSWATSSVEDTVRSISSTSRDRRTSAYVRLLNDGDSSYAHCVLMQKALSASVAAGPRLRQ